MSIKRFTQPVDGTIPVQALLYDDEELLVSQDNVGIYDGTAKSPAHQSGTVHATSHRLFFLSSAAQSFPTLSPASEVDSSFALDLALVTLTDYYVGLFASSPKATLHLSRPAKTEISASSADPSHRHTDDMVPGWAAWECEVCAYRNPPGLSPQAARICGLCGVPRSSMPPELASVVPISPLKSISGHVSPIRSHISSSLPSSGFATPSPAPDLEITSGNTASSATETDGAACPACTFINHRALRACELCGTTLPRSPIKKAALSAKSAPASRPASPVDDGDAAEGTIRLSFRRGGGPRFYEVLKRSLQTKAWVVAPARARTDTQGIGIHGLLNMMESSAITAEGAVSNAFTDLDALMRAAGTMVALAADLNDRLTTAQAASAAQHTDAPLESEETMFVRSSLVQLGLALPGGAVTKDMAADDHKWHVELSRELAALLQGSIASTSTIQAGIMSQKPIVPLDEVWGAWNRARGVALLPPSTLLAVLPLLPAVTSPNLADRTLKSGLRVLHTPEYAPAAFALRVAASLGSDIVLAGDEEAPDQIRGGGKTTAEIAHAERLTVALARELVEEAEERGMFMREDAKTRLIGSTAGGAAQVKWWPNLVKGWTWDGQEHEDD